MNRPKWWDWELEITPHVEKRMIQRSFTEIELREMFDRATSLQPGKEIGRYVAVSTLGTDNWEIILEPDFEEKLIVVITAYPIGS
ncbi:MAG: DUF4258 domain-containing protein [Candidatus Brocadiales bacterium]|nr:DUF4258 domain-containing protein [Candidatus Brocadiales bacterium]